MSWFSKAVRKLNNFIADVDPITKNSPDFQMQKDAFETGNWDKPYGEEKSAWDVLGAGPSAQITKDGKTAIGLDPNEPGTKGRTTGRLVGTVIADYWTFGLFSQVVKPSASGAPTMNLENDGEKMAFGSLTSPGVVTSTGEFVSDASSVTPAQAQLALSMDEIKKWAWYGAAIIALFFILSRKGILR